ncbi:LysR family transcriptional regulator [Denitromonas iodatirespirans]|uniref:LysR family transcriptional regulator n=1 Tax=Denitromonas iodatirespirans TaxID=2795389 RepID=A0A944H700_DENI1|nr:LysR family transcriptional regulator [Denitromonas iodatirespirans]MBT0960683.1 LysR family transcriptional regulator [Denitromonas iodatirespirans]
MKLDLDLLHIFDAMLRDQSVTLAAERLNTSQPTVSYGLKKLRETLGDELFVRTVRGMEPTPKALALAGPVRQMLHILERDFLNPPGFDPKSSERVFTINTTDIGEIAFLPHLMTRLRETAPMVSIKSVCLPTRELAQALADGVVDLAIGYQPDLPEGNIFVQRLFEHPFVCLVRDGHPHIRTGLTLEQYTAAEHMAVLAEGHHQKHIEALINKSVPKRRVTLWTQLCVNAAFIVRDTDVVATVPRAIGFIFAQWMKLRVFPPPLRIPEVPINQYWHSKFNRDPALVWLRRTLAELFIANDPTVDFTFTE